VNITDSYGVPRYLALDLSFAGLSLWHPLDTALPTRYSGSGWRSVMCKKRPWSCRGGPRSQGSGISLDSLDPGHTFGDAATTMEGGKN
jgi:hypothetical protein